MAMRKNSFAKTGLLLRFYLRRDWLKILVWLIGLAGLMAAAAGKFDTLYGDAKSMASISTTLKSPAMVSMFGPFTAVKPYTSAIIYAAEMMVFMGLFTAMMNIYFAVKNSRNEEDSGVAELVSAHAVGRGSQLLAATIEIILINLIIGCVEALGLQASGMTGISANGSWLFGLSLAAFGIMFAAISLLCAQIVSSARSATMLSYGVLGILYVARMATDVKNPDLTWWTIFGWIEKLDVYHDNHWAPLLLMLGFAIIVGAFAFFIAGRRDVGSGILPTARGRRNASLFLAGPFSLLARLERTSTIVWLLGLFLLGASYGSIFGNVGDLMKTNPTMARLIGHAAVESANRVVVLSFASTLTIIFAVVASIPAMMTILRLNTDERKGYLEQLHARGVSRLRIFGTHMLFATLVGTATLVLGIIGMGIAGNATLAHPIDLSRYLRGFVGYWPALFVIIGITALIVSLVLRLQALAWLLPVYGFFSLYLGELLNLPEWAQKLSPYGWVNQVPLKAIDWLTAGWMTGLGFILIIIAYIIYRHRDLKIN